MATAPLSTADVLDRCASDMMMAACEFRIPARHHETVERRIGEVERILNTARAAVRGKHL